ncbi:hypothetical protein THALO_290413 [Tenacibaculum halocynthiae]
MTSRQQPYTLPSRSKAHRTSQNLSKSMFDPTLKNEMNKIKTAYNNVYSA